MKFRALAAATAALMTLGQVAVANAAPPSPDPVELADGLVGPLALSVGPGKAVTVSESFAGRLTTVADGDTTTTYTNPGWDVSGSAYRGSTLYFLESVGAGPMDPRPMVGVLKSIDSKGNVETITADLAQYEIDNNLDSDVRYGLSEADAAANPDCVAQVEALGVPGSYTGADVEVDSHVYGLAVQGNTAYVADAGANAVLTVNLTTGEISTLAVLPAHPVELTEDMAEAIGVPACAGLTYAFEAVPTDIEVGPDGMIYVATLPGGPEDESLGRRGMVFRIDPVTGDAEVYASGLLSPTGIAFDGKGNLYVASLFGEGVYRIMKGSDDATLFLPAMMAAEVDIRGSTLYVTTEVFGDGKLVSYKL